MDADAQKAKIRELNDLCRTAMGVTARVTMSEGITAEFDEAARSRLRERVELFDDFTPANDPWQEHDYGSFDFEGTRVYFKIDYFAKGSNYLSPDPSSSALTRRELTIALSSEY